MSCSMVLVEKRKKRKKGKIERRVLLDRRALELLYGGLIGEDQVRVERQQPHRRQRKYPHQRLPKNQ